MSKEAIQKAIIDAKDRMHNVDMNIVGAGSGVYQAIDALQQGLARIDACIQLRDYHTPSRIGYNEVAHSFVFLQRTLAGLQDAIDEKAKLISDIAVESGVGVYEEVEPFVHEAMGSMQILTDEERTMNRKPSVK